MQELEYIKQCHCANQAATFLMNGLSRILDNCAPVKTFQTRENYAPHLKEATKLLMEERNNVQKAAATTGSQEDWWEY